ncbi:MAG: SPOR domain-containing protein, partial [Herminiimonas sp.]|nr:SPOR domain-containing protein [Herminiimonas sp.]
MSLFSFLRKNKHEPTADDSAFYSRAEEDSDAVRGRGRRKNSKQANAENQPVDPVLPEKKRARRRLVGAVALVLAVIIGLPMVLDSEPKPLADDIAIQIPSKDKPYVPTGGVKQSDPVASAGVAASTTLDAKEEFVDTPPAVVPKTVVVPPPAIKPKQPVRQSAPAKVAALEKPEA